MASNRMRSLDILRGIAILSMLEAHIQELIILQNPVTYYTSFIPYIANRAGIFSAPFFLIISGLGFQFFIENRKRKKQQINLIFYESILRALLLYIISTLFLFIASIVQPSAYSFTYLNWNVFQVIGMSYILGCIISIKTHPKNDTFILFSMYFIIFITYDISNILILNKNILLLGVFPFIPYYSFFIFGQLSYKLYEINIGKLINTLIPSVFIILTSLIFITDLSLNFDYRENILLASWLCIFHLTLQLLFINFIDLKNLNNFTLKLTIVCVEALGKIAFSLYYLHLGLIIFTMIVLRYFEIEIFGSADALNIILFTIFMTSFSIFSLKWKNINYKWGLEWLFRQSTNMILNKLK